MTRTMSCSAELPPQRVLLLPGIWMRPWTMRLLASRMAAEGFSVRTLGYPGVIGSREKSLTRLLPALVWADAVVAHSLGGLMTLEALRRHPEVSVRRVVCLGSPLNGSGVAMWLRERHLGRVLGGSGDLLVQGCALPWPGRAEVGAVAGSASHGLGRILANFPGTNDGTVGLEETQWPGLLDHTVVSASHTGLLLSRSAARQTVHFLRHGRFAPAA